MQQCHRAHDTRLVRREEREARQQVLRAALILGCISSHGSRLGCSEVGYFADGIECCMSERMAGGCAGIICHNRLGKVVLVGVWTGHKGDDGKLCGWLNHPSRKRLEIDHRLTSSLVAAL